MRAAAWLVSAVALVLSAAAGNADTLTCSTFAGVATCLGDHGYVSHESTWNGITTGDDNDGRRWSSWRWQGLDIITSTPER